MITEILAAMAGVWAFGVLFHAPSRSYFFCALAGAISWGVYAGAIRLGWSVFPATAASAMCLTLYSRVLAVRQRLPSTIFIVTGIFPIVPGAGIYYTAYYLVMKDYSLATAKGLETLAAAGAIALGILVGSELPHRRSVARAGGSCYTKKD